MTDELPQAFNDFARGVISPETFEHELLSLCKRTPDRAWEALALLDQHYRRGRVAAELQHSLRQRIERQALGIESYQPERAPLAQIAVARAIPVAPDADAEDPTIETIVGPSPAAHGRHALRRPTATHCHADADGQALERAPMPPPVACPVAAERSAGGRASMSRPPSP